MKPVAIRYVRDMATARDFYAALGLDLDFASRPNRSGHPAWVELAGTGSGLALHGLPADDPKQAAVELCFEADEPLERVVERLRAAGYAAESAIVDESFGRSFTVRDPEGLLIQINEQDRELQG
ncbi:glyoxalase/bleomycin resistance protein/dioxygenase superfamily protein [Tamaricihabitans halophyticus]|uniref:Glyoxalase/bleomycin resistance protein/dioxygenase superfamily protein n=1 Tax=Tamaricihabitans halophyticus TaxID=1262583 RepID=A0A4V2SV82_9PSEU|nr:VOC family protein [Tamaricihabitans halophyticus]TCP57516.1 glyoxalase/bleomycin resistance protein/dioxygenase superfamily protein [Tamaricihabitans halophyticus]